MRGARIRGGCVSDFKAEFPPATESGVAVICILLYATEARFELHAGASRLPTSLATLPIPPEARGFHLVVETRFTKHLFELRARLPRANSRGTVGQCKCR